MSLDLFFEILNTRKWKINRRNEMEHQPQARNSTVRAFFPKSGFVKIN